MPVTSVGTPTATSRACEGNAAGARRAPGPWRSSRASAQKCPILVLREPESSTGAGSLLEQLSRALQLGEQRIEDRTSSKAAPPTLSACVERSRSMPWRLMICRPSPKANLTELDAPKKSAHSSEAMAWSTESRYTRRPTLMGSVEDGCGRDRLVFMVGILSVQVAHR